MKLWHIIVGIIVLLIGGGVFWYFTRDWEIKNYPSTMRGPILMYGDSLVEGVGANPGLTLPEQLGNRLGTEILNYGVSGDTTRDGLARLDDALEMKPRVAIVLLGGNDFLKKIPRAETFANLEQIVTAFQRGGAITVVVGVRSGIIGGGADDEFEALAEKTGSVSVSDVLGGIFGQPDLMSDAIHPNSVGYGRIADRLAPLLLKYVK